MTVKPTLSFVQTVVVGLSCLVLVLVAFRLTSTIQESSSQVFVASEAARHTAAIEARSGEVIQRLSAERQEFLASPQTRALDPILQTELARELGRSDSSPTSAAVSEQRFTLSVAEAVAAKGMLDDIRAEVQSARNFLTLEEGQKLADASNSAQRSQDDFFALPTVGTYRLLRLDLISLRDMTREMTPVLLKAAAEHRRPISTSAGTLWYAVLAVTLLGGGATALISWMANRRQAVLVGATRTLTRRNEQFRALYNVFSEITDTLSLKYVVATTVQEALNLVDADVVVVRLLRGDELYVAGSLNKSGEDASELQTIQLGEGLIGRAAKRGKTLQIDSNAEGQMLEGQKLTGVQSGIAVPLIVGARVVGTLACWSKKQSAFSSDDAMILEMMASQVATAVAAAETTETNERRAYNDALTGLPNRRQLAEDIAHRLPAAVGTAGRASLAMVDIDHFKRFNDDFGHRVGDVTLQRVASVLRSSVREGDLVYRYGGEEFLIFMHGADQEAALKLLERVRASVQATPLTGESLEPIGTLTVSIGFACLPSDAGMLTDAIDLADKAMYESKRGGRNRVSAVGVTADLLGVAA